MSDEYQEAIKRLFYELHIKECGLEQMLLSLPDKVAAGLADDESKEMARKVTAEKVEDLLRRFRPQK